MRLNPSFSQRDELSAGPSTVARHRSLIPSDQRRGQPDFAVDTCLMLQFLPSGTCYCLSLETPVTLGRKNGLSHIDILDLTAVGGYHHGVSHYHCVLRREGQSLLITDRGSAHGTYLNGRRVNPGQDYWVAHGDRLVLGTLHVDVFFMAPDQIGLPGLS